MKPDFHPAVRQTALSPRHIPLPETECEREVRVRGASTRIAAVYGLPLKRAQLLIRYSSVRVRA